ncbi:hypothetical protein [Rhodopirellula europaea]|uniref:hypothetical protein n=1 Tax=Rhodopirellula europaea TaxID=1263866 RepID=UPI003D2A31DE|tara:strand:+ start:7118 stop:7366 length:249 start_codon:yes stop_codon:yes gene_type:complete
MDPNETFEAMIDAWAQGLTEEAAAYAESLTAWLHRGGFPPQLKVVFAHAAPIQVTGDLSRVMIESACRMVLSHPDQSPSPQP